MTTATTSTERPLGEGPFASAIAFGPVSASRRSASELDSPAARCKACFFFAYVLAGWRPWEHLAGSGMLYTEATTMTMAGIVFAQVGAGMAWRTTRESVRTIGFLSNRMLLVGMAVEIAMVAVLAYMPGIDDVFHTSALSGWEWLFLLVWPPVVFVAEELRKALVRRRSA